MKLVVAAARSSLPVLGICNGFQILCEAHLPSARSAASSTGTVWANIGSELDIDTCYAGNPLVSTLGVDVMWHSDLYSQSSANPARNHSPSDSSLTQLKPRL